MIAVDTNLLVYAHMRSAAEHADATDALRTAADDPRGWGFSAQVGVEFWNVVTHGRHPEPSSPALARAFLQTLEDRAGARIFLPRRGFIARLADQAQRRAIRGARIFDLQIALCAVEAGATELWTHDATFAAMPGLRLYDPLKA